METLQSTIFIEFDVNTKKITFLRKDNVIDYDSNSTYIYVRVKYKDLSGNTTYLTPSELEGYDFFLYTIKPATNNINEIAGEVTDELKENAYGGVVKFKIPRACTNRLGIVKCEIHINQWDKMIASSTFVLDVKQSLVTEFNDALLDDEDFPVLKQLILEIQKASNINDDDPSLITTYSSDKIEDIKENLDLQIEEKASKQEVDIERKRIDNLTSLPEGSTIGDAELQDIRVGADGMTYSNAGTSVRTQISEIRENLFYESYNKFNYKKILNNKQISKSGSIVDYNGMNVLDDRILVNAGENWIICIVGNESIDYSLAVWVAYYGEDGTFISKNVATNPYDFKTTWKKITINDKNHYVKPFVIPQNASYAKLQIQSDMPDNIVFCLESDFEGVYKDVYESSRLLETDFLNYKNNHEIVHTMLNENVDLLKDQFKTTINLFNHRNILLNKTIEAGGVETDDASWFITTDYIEVEPNESYYFNVYDFDDYATGYRVFMCLYDENKNYISKNDGVVGSQMEIFDSQQVDGVVVKGKRFTIPEGAKYVKLQIHNNIVDCKEINFSKTSDLTKTYTHYLVPKYVEIPKYEEVDLNGYASCEYVDERISNISSKITNLNIPTADTHLLLNSFNNAQDIITCFANSINFDNEAGIHRSKIGEGYFSHDSTLAVDENGIGYVCYVQNDVDLADHAGSVNAYTELAVLDLNNLSTSTSVERFNVAKHNDSIEGKNVELGAGVPNCVVIGTKVYCIFSVKLESVWYLCNRVFNTDTKTFEDAKLCKFTKDGTTYDFTTDNLSTIASSYTGNLDTMVSMNAQISYNESDQYYYCGVCVNNKIKNSLIFRTKDFYTFEFWLEPNFTNECNSNFEGACLCNDGNLYYALRQEGLGKPLYSNYMIIAKFNIATKNKVDEIIIPDAGSRACWFKDDSNNIYLAHSMNKRATVEFLKIDKNYLCDSRIILQGISSYVYPSIVKYGDYYYICSTGSSSTCIYVRRFTLNKFNNETVRNKFISLLNISN